MTHQLIEIKKLEKSPHNVRKTVAKGADESLKASILAHGLLQNLVVTKHGKNKYRVIEGARRLEALKALQAEGRLGADYAVPCQFVSGEIAAEQSLAANTVRLAMHPADEFEAFAALADDHTPEQIAQRFGVSEKHVLQRLKLGRVAPALLAAYRDEELTLDCLMAFAVTDDQRKQIKVYEALPEHLRSNASRIRRALTETMVEADSKLASFVGLDAYHEAGGTTKSDLFGDEVYLENPELLQSLANAKLEAIRKELKAEGWGWVEIAMEQDYGFLSGCGRIRPIVGDIPAELAGELDQARAELDAIADEADAEGDSDELLERQEAAEAKLWEIEERIEALASFDPNDIRLAGCYVTIDHDGSLRIDKGVVKRQDMKRLAVDGAMPAKPKGMPETLKRDLEAFRLQVAQVEIASHRLIALDLLTFTLARSQFGTTLHTGPDVALKQHTAVRKQDTVAAQAMEAIKEALPLGWLEERSEAGQYRRFIHLSDTEKLDILAYCVAVCLRPQLATGNGGTAYELALSLTEGNVAGYWRPTKESYLGRITRDQLLTLTKELMGVRWADARSRDKKGEIAATLERVFADPAKYAASPDQAAMIAKWLPEGMAFTALPTTETAAEQAA